MWNSDLDAELMRLRKRGLSFGQISVRMGVTRAAVIGRFNRLIGNVFPSDAARLREKAADARRRAAARFEKQRHLAKKLRADIAAGKDRDRAIKEAYEAHGKSDCQSYRGEFPAGSEDHHRNGSEEVRGALSCTASLARIWQIRCSCSVCGH